MKAMASENSVSPHQAAVLLTKEHRYSYFRSNGDPSFTEVRPLVSKSEGPGLCSIMLFAYPVPTVNVSSFVTCMLHGIKTL
jgi:hypothetical protein